MGGWIGVFVVGLFVLWWVWCFGCWWCCLLCVVWFGILFVWLFGFSLVLRWGGFLVCVFGCGLGFWMSRWGWHNIGFCGFIVGLLFGF